MPKIPQIQGPRIQSQPSDLGQTAYGTYIASRLNRSALGQYGKADRAVSNASDAIQKILSAQAYKTSQTVVMQAANRVRALRGQMQEEFSQLRGLNAQASEATYIDRFNNELKDITNSLPNSLQKEMFIGETSGEFDHFSTAVKVHSGRQLQMARQKEAQDGIEFGLDSFRRTQSIEDLNQAITYGDVLSEGLGPNAKTRVKQRIIEQAYAGRIEGLLQDQSADSIASAEKILASPKLRAIMTDKVHSDLSVSVAKASVRITARDRGEELIAKHGGDFSMALSEANDARGSLSPSLGDALVSYIRSRSQNAKIAEQDSQKATAKSMWNAYAEAGGAGFFGDLNQLFSSRGIDPDPQVLIKMQNQQEIAKNRLLSRGRTMTILKESRLRSDDEDQIAQWRLEGRFGNLTPDEIGSKLNDPVLIDRVSRANEQAAKIPRGIESPEVKIFNDFNKRLVRMGSSPISLKRTAAGKVVSSGDTSAAMQNAVHQDYYNAISSLAMEKGRNPTDAEAQQAAERVANSWTSIKGQLLSQYRDADEYYSAADPDDWDEYDGNVRSEASAIIISARGAVSNETISDDVKELVAEAVKNGNRRLAHILANMRDEDWF